MKNRIKVANKADGEPFYLPADTVIFELPDADFRISISEGKISIVKVGKVDDTISVSPIVSNKITVQ